MFNKKKTSKPNIQIYCKVSVNHTIDQEDFYSVKTFDDFKSALKYLEEKESIFPAMPEDKQS